VDEFVLLWRKEGPAGFAKHVFGVTPTEQQWEASRALVEKRKVSVRSGHGTGKSTFMAWAALWFMFCYFPCKVPCTAPTGHQLSDILWAEIAKWLGVLKDRVPELAAQIEWKSESVELKEAPRESFAVARTARPERPEALQGFHSENILFLIDEASGISDEVFQVAEGALSTEGAFVLMAGNPTRMDGYFYDSHHKMRARWAALWWNGEDSPMVSKLYIEDMRDKYGEDSAIYKIRVRGEFAGNPDGVIPLELIESAKIRDVKPFGDEVWGLDVARFGEDRTALAKRRRNTMPEPVESWRGKDTMQTAGMVKLRYDAAKVKPAAIYVDVIGLGAGVVDRMLELDLPVVAVNVAETASANDKYNRLRDELWFAAREWFSAKDVRFAEDEALTAELTLPNYRITSSGKIQVESKDEMKRRGVTSPDLADAFCMTFAQGMPINVTNRRMPIKYPEMGIV
jgi:phage terminase large subunit